MITCASDREWQDLVKVMGSPAWAVDAKLDLLEGRIRHQEEMDQGIEAWTKTLDKYELMELCQGAGVRAMPVQSSEDRVEHDEQLRHREMYTQMPHPMLGPWKFQNAPFKMSKTPPVVSSPPPMIGEHNREVLEDLLGVSHEEVLSGHEDGVLWPKGMPTFPYIEEALK